MLISFPAVLLRLTVAILLGAVVGFERETREHAAGIRTNALVALGAALFTVISAYGFTEMLNVPHVQLDPTRIASYVIAGIGFLGGGAIFFVQDKERVKGLTTAAAVWVVAAIGMACGAGLLWEAISSTVLVLAVLILLRFVERRLLQGHTSSPFHIRIETTGAVGENVNHLYTICTQRHVAIEKIGVRSAKDHEIVTLACHTHNVSQLTHVIEELRALPHVLMVEADIKGAGRKDLLQGDIES